MIVPALRACACWRACVRVLCVLGVCAVLWVASRPPSRSGVARCWRWLVMRWAAHLSPKDGPQAWSSGPRRRAPPCATCPPWAQAGQRGPWRGRAPPALGREASSSALRASNGRSSERKRCSKVRCMAVCGSLPGGANVSLSRSGGAESFLLQLVELSGFHLRDEKVSISIGLYKCKDRPNRPHGSPARARLAITLVHAPTPLVARGLVVVFITTECPSICRRALFPPAAGCSLGRLGLQHDCTPCKSGAPQAAATPASALLTAGLFSHAGASEAGASVLVDRSSEDIAVRTCEAGRPQIFVKCHLIDGTTFAAAGRVSRYIHLHLSTAVVGARVRLPSGATGAASR